MYCSSSLQDATGLRVYFDKALHHCLLYDHEVDECEKVRILSMDIPHHMSGGVSVHLHLNRKYGSVRATLLMLPIKVLPDAYAPL